MRRRDFISALAGVATPWPSTIFAQSIHGRRIAVLIGTSDSDSSGQSYVKALRRGLSNLDWVEGRNIAIDIYWTNGNLQRTRMLAVKLVESQPDVIIAHAGVRVLHQQTRTIPIIFILVPDPVGSRFVASLARPGGNITGFTNFEFSMVSKWLSLLKEIAPSVARVGILYNPEMSPGLFYFRALSAVASPLAIEPIGVPVLDEEEIELTCLGLYRDSNAGLVVVSDSFTMAHRESIIALAAKYRIPAVYPARDFVNRGGLISYGIDEDDLFRQSASYVDRLLKGNKPVDLPVQAPTKFELVINLKTAKTLGLSIPPMLLATATEAIE